MSVLVFTENWDGRFKKLTFELVSYAAKTAAMLNTNVTALSIGKVEDSELKKLGNYGAAKIISIENDALRVLDNQVFTSVISDVAGQESAQVIVLSNNNTGKALAPRLSVRLKAGIGSGVSKLPLSLEPFTVYKRTYSGNAYAHQVIRTTIKIITLAQNSFELAETSNSAVIEKRTVNVDSTLVKTICERG